MGDVAGGVGASQAAGGLGHCGAAPFIRQQFAHEREEAVELAVLHHQGGAGIGQVASVEALVAAGHAANLDQAKAQVRGFNLDYPVQMLALEVAALGEIIGRDGALCVMAHPARDERGVSARLLEDDISPLRELIPLVGLEAYHPYHSPGQVEEYQQMAERHGLVITCGSDAHGWAVRRPPKPHPLPILQPFLDLVLQRWQAPALPSG